MLVFQMYYERVGISIFDQNSWLYCVVIRCYSIFIGHYITSRITNPVVAFVLNYLSVSTIKTIRSFVFSFSKTILDSGLKSNVTL